MDDKSTKVYTEDEDPQDMVTQDKKRDKLRSKRRDYLKRRMAAMEG